MLKQGEYLILVFALARSNSMNEAEAITNQLDVQESQEKKRQQVPLFMIWFLTECFLIHPLVCSITGNKVSIGEQRILQRSI